MDLIVKICNQGGKRQAENKRGKLEMKRHSGKYNDMKSKEDDNFKKYYGL